MSSRHRSRSVLGCGKSERSTEVEMVRAMASSVAYVLSRFAPQASFGIGLISSGLTTRQPPNAPGRPCQPPGHRSRCDIRQRYIGSAKMQSPPARVGDKIDDIETPALVVDLDAFENNLSTMQSAADRLGVKLRPHAKTHKFPLSPCARWPWVRSVNAARKWARPAMVDGGILNVLVSNEIVDAGNWASCCARGSSQHRRLRGSSRPDRSPGRGHRPLRHADRGPRRNRCRRRAVRRGPGAPAVALAQAIEAAPGLSFGGLQAYHGSAQHIRGWGERRQPSGTPPMGSHAPRRRSPPPASRARG